MVVVEEAFGDVEVGDQHVDPLAEQRAPDRRELRRATRDGDAARDRGQLLGCDGEDPVVQGGGDGPPGRVEEP